MKCVTIIHVVLLIGKLWFMGINPYEMYLAAFSSMIIHNHFASYSHFLHLSS